MKQIELSISAAMSLTCMSSSGSDEENEESEQTQGEEILSMSDEEFGKMSEADFVVSDKENESNEDETLGDENEEAEASEDADEEEPQANAEDGGSEQAEDEEEAEADQPNENTEQSDEDVAAREAAFELLYGQPIKASGRNVQLRNLDHANNFIEMGIDYNKKMQSMKPHLKVLKTLEKEGLLNDEKAERLNLLLEVEKGNKDALKRLIADSGMDPLDLADDDVIEKGKSYTPQNQIVSDQEVEIDEAFSAIEGSPSQQRTLNVMTKEFDAKSRQVISENPRYIVALNNDIEAGIFDEVMEAVQYRRDMKLVPDGVSDMELYIDTVREIAGSEQTAPTVVNTNEQTKPNNSTQSRETRRRKVGMSGNKSSRKPKKRQYDPIEILGKDDEKFIKEMGMDLL
jgi:hypothetical protein